MRDGANSLVGLTLLKHPPKLVGAERERLDRRERPDRRRAWSAVQQRHLAKVFAGTKVGDGPDGAARIVDRHGKPPLHDEVEAIARRSLLNDHLALLRRELGEAASQHRELAGRQAAKQRDRRQQPLPFAGKRHVDGVVHPAGHHRLEPRAVRPRAVDVRSPRREGLAPHLVRLLGERPLGPVNPTVRS